MRYGYKITSNNGSPIGYANGFKSKDDAAQAVAAESRCGSYMDGLRVVRCKMTDAQFAAAA